MSVRRILVVDDYAPASQALARLLRLDGHIVQSASTAAEAMTIALDFRPEVVLLDINLGGDTDGLTVARWMRAQDNLGGVLLVAMTGQRDPETARRLAEAGFDRHLVKPMPFADIEQLITDAQFG